MNFSAEKAARKWPCGRSAAMVTAVAALLSVCAPSGPAAAAAKPGLAPWSGLFRVSSSPPRTSLSQRRAALPASVPLPRPRPPEAPAIAAEPPEAARQAPGASDKPAEQAATPAPPPPSACRVALTEDVAIAPSIADIHGPGGCGGEDLVRLEAVVLPDKRRVALKPAAILRCAMASEIAAWVRTDIAPLTTSLGSVISVLDNFDSFECRGRNRVVGAQLSEHGRANALDVRAFKLANGEMIGLTDVNVAKDWRDGIRVTACARFSTVLGPGSDGHHEEHIHVDLAERRGGYKMCQWDVRDGAAIAEKKEPPVEAAASAADVLPDPVPLPRPRPLAANATRDVQLRTNRPRAQ
jgi:hypothetical protein